MKTLCTIFIITLLFNIGAFAQRDNNNRGRGQESGLIERIDRIQESTKRNNTIQRTIQPKQTITQVPIPIQPTTSVYIEQYQQGDCIVKQPDKYNFPDRIYEIPYIKPVLQYFYIEDFDGSIELLNYLIDENPFVPELYFLRGVAYN